MTRRIETLLVVVCPLIALTAGCASAPQAAEPATPVRAERVKPAIAERGVRYSAQIVPVDQVSLSFKTSGYVLDLLQVKDESGRPRDLEKGDAVDAGALLARVEERDYLSKVARAEAGVAQARAGEEKSLQDLNRAEALFAAEALVRPDLDAARASHRSATAQIAAARADIEVAASARRRAGAPSRSRGARVTRCGRVRARRGRFVESGVRCPGLGGQTAAHWNVARRDGR